MNKEEHTMPPIAMVLGYLAIKDIPDYPNAQRDIYDTLFRLGYGAIEAAILIKAWGLRRSR